MPETIHVRGEGGAIFAMDLPLPEGIQERYDSGLLQRVHPDGAPWHGAPALQPSGPDTDDEQVESDPSTPGSGRPGVNASKADWIAYVVKSGRMSAEDAANFTKADLIDLMS